MSKFHYRPEIDGLRAIAVVSVVMYHAQILIFTYHPFQGGFVGVDVFFVISGYLITSIILNDHRWGNFSILSFYGRRVRRILPALLTVILVSFPFAWIIMLPEKFMEYAGSILATLGFSSNFWFYFYSDYWMEDRALYPYLHTWSLSV